jgi:hypothetical protein
VGYLMAGVVLATFFALGEAFGYVRAGVAVAVFFLMARFGVRWMRSAVTSQPEPEVADVSEYGLKYVCTMCGLELKIEVAAKDRAPSHCMEPMVLVRTDQPSAPPD